MPGEREMHRQWFIPGDGIDRNVISADIQRYLGNDATVRPGIGTNEHAGVNGYWIKAYRNLTGPMIEDLKADSNRWRQEQRSTTNRGSQSPYYKIDVSGKQVPDPFSVSGTYTGSNTYRDSNAGRPSRRETESPIADNGPYGQIGSSWMGPPDARMQIDPSGAPPRRPYQQDQPVYPMNNPPYGDTRGYQNDPRGYPMDPSMQSAYNRGQGTQQYQQDNRYPNYSQSVENNPGQYQRGQPNFGGYVAVSSPYDPNPPLTANRSDSTSYGTTPYSHPPQAQDPNRPVYRSDTYPPEPRYAYPSPAATTVGPSNTREPITSPPQQSPNYSASTASAYPQYNDRRSGGQYRS